MRGHRPATFPDWELDGGESELSHVSKQNPTLDRRFIEVTGYSILGLLIHSYRVVVL